MKSMNKSKLYIAFDLSLHHTGWAVYLQDNNPSITPKVIEVGIINTDLAENELLYLYEEITKVISKYNNSKYFVTIFKEKQAQQMSGGKTTVKTIVGLAKAHAICELACSKLGLFCTDVSALTAKVFVVGKGHRDASKEEVLNAVLSKFNYLEFEQFGALKYDVADAVAVALTADFVLEQSIHEKIKENNTLIRKYKKSIEKRKNKRLSEKIIELEEENKQLKNKIS